MQNQAALNYYNDRKNNVIQEIDSLRLEFDGYDLYEYARRLSEFIEAIPDVKFDCIRDVGKWHEMISTEFKKDICEIETKIEEAQSKCEEIKDSDKNKTIILKNICTN